MLEKWLDKKLEKLGYIKATNGLSIKTINDAVLNRVKLEAQYEDCLQSYLDTRESFVKQTNVVLAQCKDLLSNEHSKNEKIIADELDKAKDKLKEELRIGLEKARGDTSEVRIKVADLQNYVAQHSNEELEKSLGVVQTDLQNEINELKRTLDKAIYDMTQHTATIDEFGKKYNSVIRPRSRFIND